MRPFLLGISGDQSSSLSRYTYKVEFTFFAVTQTDTLRVVKTWEIIMDDHCIVRNRPLNPEATRLLRRPRTLGPVLILEATHLKLTPEKSLGPDGTPLIDTILYHPLDLKWLESDEWKGLREEWQHLRTHGVEPVDGHNRDIAYGTHNDMQIRPFLDAMGIRMVYEVEPVTVDR